MSLNRKQIAFCEYFVREDNASKAAVLAGYSKKSCRTTGHTMKRDPRIKEEIARLRGNVASKAGICVDDVLRMHQDVYYGACRDGKWGDANKAAEALGRFLGMDNKSKQHIHFGIHAHMPAIDKDIDRLAKIAGVEMTTSSGGRA